MKLIMVEWIDAITSAGWEKFDDADGIHECKSVGFLIREDDRQIILAGSISISVDAKECNATTAIPKAWIKKRKVIKYE